MEYLMQSGKLNKMHHRSNPISIGYKGFTFIELIVVLTLIALMMTVVTPKYFNSITQSKEKILKQQLFTMRDALSHFQADQGRYPLQLDELVTKRYLRELPIDPMTESNQSWKKMTYQEWIVLQKNKSNTSTAIESQPIQLDSARISSQEIVDVHSGSTALNQLGEPYETW
jgi:prepilin-type N-terminal cleavage/methylation domain-containing protein